MKKMKRVLSIALSIMMLASTVNFTAFAEDTKQEVVKFPTDTKERVEHYFNAACENDCEYCTGGRTLIAKSGPKDALVYSEDATDIAQLGAENWGIGSVITLNTTSAARTSASALTFLHKDDRGVVDAYYKYAANVKAIPTRAEFYYTRHANTTLSGGDDSLKYDFLDIIYGISPTTSSEITMESDPTTVIGTKYETTLYFAGFNIAQDTTTKEYKVRTRALSRKVTESVYNDGTTSVAVQYETKNTRNDQTFSALGLENTDLASPNNESYNNSTIDLTKLLKVEMNYDNQTPTFSIFGMFTVTDAESSASEVKNFELQFTPTQAVAEGTKKAVGIYAAKVAGKDQMAGAFADPVITYNVPECTHELTHVEAKEPTEAENGNIEYWYCNAENGCGKYYRDAEGTVEIEDKTSVIIHGWDVVAYSMSTDNQFGIAEVSGGATAVVDGTNITLTAATKPGYSFKGWYQATVEEEACTGYTGEVLSKELSYTFSVTADGNYVAVYEANGKVSLTVNGYGIKINERAQLSSNVVTSYRAGSQVKVAYEGADFKYWKNGSGKIVSKEAAYTFTLVNATELILVTAGTGTGADAAFVEFVSDYEQVLCANTWYANDKASDHELPVGPSKVGYEFTGWTMDVEDIISAISTDDDSHIVVEPLYSEIQNQVTVTVYNGAEQNNPVATETMAQGSTYTVVATKVEGSTFSYWEDGERTILSYNSEYTLLVSEDITIRAVYNAENVDVKPVVAITGVTPKTEGEIKKVTIVATRSIPSGYTFVQTGMLYDNAGYLNADELDATLVLDGSNVSKLVSTSTSAPGAYVAHIIDGDSNVYARAYIMVMNNATGNIETYYSSPISTSFETLSN